MGATRINHVSIHAVRLEESVRFYEELFGMERIPAAKFAAQEVAWLRLGSQQLHIFRRDGTDAPLYHHLGLDVDDFETVYKKAKELGLLDATLGGQIREHPAGWVQMYIRDPAGNLIEIDWPDASTLDRSVVTDIKSLDDDVPQTGDAAVATLYHATGATSLAR